MHGLGVLLQRQSLLASWLHRTHAHTFVDSQRVCGTTLVEHVGCGAVTTHAAVVTDKGDHMVVLDACLGGSLSCASQVYRAVTAAVDNLKKT